MSWQRGGILVNYIVFARLAQVFTLLSKVELLRPGGALLLTHLHASKPHFLGLLGSFLGSDLLEPIISRCHT